MPTRMPSVKVHFVLSKDGQHDALRHGEHPSAVQTIEVTPDSPLWRSVIDLRPAVTRTGDAHLVVGHRVTTNLVSASPPERSYAPWPRPRLDVNDRPGLDPDLIARTSLVRFDTWPSLEDLVRAQSEHLRTTGTAVDQARKRHAEVLGQWRQWWRERFLIWAAELRDALDHPDIPADWPGRRDADRLIAELQQPWCAEGEFAEDDDADDQLESLTESVREMDERIEKQGRKERQRREHEANRQARSRALDDGERWIAEHGSIRLRRIVGEGLLQRSQNVYRDERLALERPGWVWLDKRVTVHEPVAPPEEAFTTLDDARGTAPSAALAYVTFSAGLGEFDEFEAESCEEWVAIDDFLGRRIAYGTDRLSHVVDPPAPFDPNEEPF